VHCDRFIGLFKDPFFKRIYYIALDGKTLVSYELDGVGMSGAIRRCFRTVEGWVHSQVASCVVPSGRSETVTWFPESFFTLPAPIVIVPLLPISVTPLPEACDVPFQTTHYHNIGF
jgi:hypothetical protein